MERRKGLFYRTNRRYCGKCDPYCESRTRKISAAFDTCTLTRSVILFPSDFSLSLPFFSNIPSKFARFRTRITRGIIIIKTRTVKELNKSTTNKTPIHVYLLLENSEKTRENEEHRGERSVRFFLLPPAGRAIGGEGRGSGEKERRNGVKSFLEYRRGDARIRTGIEASRWIA